MIVRSALLVLALLPSPLTAPQSGTFRGIVLDPSGAGIPNARVIVAGPESRTTATDSTGRFALASLPAGTYSVVVNATGFKVWDMTVAIDAAEERTVTITLPIAAVQNSITVDVYRLGSHEPLEPRLPGSYETVDRTELDRTHAPSVNEALRKISGLVARDEEGLGLRPNIALRGLNPTRSSKVLLLEDGIPLTFAPYGDNASYYHPPIERFDAIEVLKGSGQVAYGPSTIGGVINYLTPMPPPRRSGTAMLSAGNRSFMDAVGTFGSSRGPVGFFVDAMRKRGNGARDHTHSALSDVNGKLVVTASPAQVLTMKGTYYRERSQVTYSGLRENEYAQDARQNPFENDAFRGDRSAVSLAHHLAAGNRVTAGLDGVRVAVCAPLVASIEQLRAAAERHRRPCVRGNDQPVYNLRKRRTSAAGTFPAGSSPGSGSDGAPLAILNSAHGHTPSFRTVGRRMGMRRPRGQASSSRTTSGALERFPASCSIASPGGPER